MDLEKAAFTPASGQGLQCAPYTSEAVLTDGGVYDNLGLETVWKRYKTVLVSDAGGRMSPEPDPKHDWARHSYRVLNLIDNQVRSLRKRQLIGSFVSKEREGAYWGVRTDVKHYGVPMILSCPYEQTVALADTPTRLKTLDDTTQERLINWGYAVCDAALRAHVDKSIAPATAFPYAASGV
jgi:NTE family protein